MSLQSSSELGIELLHESQPPFPQTAGFSASGLQLGTCETLKYKQSVVRGDL